MDTISLLSEKQLNQLKNVFLKSKRARQQGISLDEFLQAFLCTEKSEHGSVQGREKMYAELTELFEEIDLNGNGYIDWKEFYSHCIGVGKAATRVEKTVFEDSFQIVKSSRTKASPFKSKTGINKLMYCKELGVIFLTEINSTKVMGFSLSWLEIGVIELDLKSSSLLAAKPEQSNEQRISSSKVNETSDRRKADTGNLRTAVIKKYISNTYNDVVGFVIDFCICPVQRILDSFHIAVSYTNRLVAVWRTSKERVASHDPKNSCNNFATLVFVKRFPQKVGRVCLDSRNDLLIVCEKSNVPKDTKLIGNEGHRDKVLIFKIYVEKTADGSRSCTLDRVCLFFFWGDFHQHFLLFS